MKTIIKVLIAILLANALFRVATAYISYYQFKDAVDEMVTRTNGSDDQLRKKVVELAERFEEPVDPDAISVRRSENHIYIETSYKKAVPVLPGYQYQWPFTVTVDGFVIVPQRPGGESPHP